MFLIDNSNSFSYTNNMRMALRNKHIGSHKLLDSLKSNWFGIHYFFDIKLNIFMDSSFLELENHCQILNELNCFMNLMRYEDESL